MEPLRRRILIGTLVVPLACGAPGGSRSIEGSESATNVVEAEPVALDAIEPDFAPALEAVQAAVRAGDDATARATLERVLLRGPSGPTLAALRAYERILDGRDAVRSLELALEIVPDDVPDRKKDEPALSTLYLSAHNAGSTAMTLFPGPATLLTEHDVLDARATVQTSSESHSYAAPSALAVDPGGDARVRLSAFFLEARAGVLAERLRFRLELRSGTVVLRDDASEPRQLPAMRLRVASARATALSSELAALGPSSSDDLVARVASGKVHEAEALEIVLRLPRDEERRALERIAELAPRVPDTDLDELAPSLRWLTSAAEPGEPEQWRALLEHRAGADRRASSSRDRGTLVLPPPRPGS